MFLITDGQSDWNSRPGPVTDSIAEAIPGIKIIALGIGSGVNNDELESMTEHTNDESILFNGFEDFIDVVDSIILTAQEFGCQSVTVGDVLNKRR